MRQSTPMHVFRPPLANLDGRGVGAERKLVGPEQITVLIEDPEHVGAVRRNPADDCDLTTPDKDLRPEGKDGRVADPCQLYANSV